MKTDHGCSCGRPDCRYDKHYGNPLRPTEPPPRLVPDRPSDAAIAAAFLAAHEAAKALGLPAATEYLDAILAEAAAAPPAEAPANELARDLVVEMRDDAEREVTVGWATRLARYAGRVSDLFAGMAAAPAAPAEGDDRCTWCGYAMSANPLSHAPSCRVRTHPQSEQAKRAASYTAPRVTGGREVTKADAVRAIEARNDYLRRFPGEAVPAMIAALQAANGGEG